MAQDTELKAVNNPTALYYSGYYPGTGQIKMYICLRLSEMIISGYYPGFRGYQPGYFNPYARFGYPGYNLLNRNLLTRPLAFRPTAVPAPVAAKEEATSLTQGTQYHFQDQMGNINYGYSNINSAKQEVSVQFRDKFSQILTYDSLGTPRLGSPASTLTSMPMVSSSWSPMWRMMVASGSSLTPDSSLPPASLMPESPQPLPWPLPSPRLL